MPIPWRPLSALFLRLCPLGMFVMLAGCGGGTKRANSGSTGAQGEGEHCLLAPDTTVDADIGSAARDRAVARGTVSDPLPIDLAIERPVGPSCVDGEGALWVVAQTHLLRYGVDLDLSLDLGLAFDLKYNYVVPLACDEQGMLLVATSINGPVVTETVGRYTKDGLVEEYTVTSSSAADSVRPSSIGPLLTFSNTLVEVDGVQYAPPDSAGGLTGVYRVLPVANAPRMVWAPRNFGVDSDGSLLAVYLQGSETSALIFERYALGGEMTATKTLAGQFSWLEPAVVTPDGHLVVAGQGYFDLPKPTHVGLPDGFVFSLDRNGDLVWSRQFSSPGEIRVAGVAIGQDASTWVFGTFEEWVEVAGAVAFGHIGEVSSSGGAFDWTWAHRFVAVIDTAGTLGALEPLGEDFEDTFEILPSAASRGFMFGRAGSPLSASRPTQVGLNGTLPTSFLGTLDLSGRTPAPMSPQPDETLPLVPVPEMDSTIAEVRSSHDGNAYVVVQNAAGLIFVDYPSGEVLPPFQPPNDEILYGTYERLGKDLFFLDGERSLRLFRLSDGVWGDQGQLSFESLHGGFCGSVLPSGEWLFVGCESLVAAYRRQGDTWVFINSVPASGSALDFDGTTLVVGEYLTRGQRVSEGVVQIYRVGADGLQGSSILKAIDPLPVDPTPPCSGDVCTGPAEGKAFGLAVQLAGERLLVEDREGSYVFEHVGDSWLQRWQHTHSGYSMLNGSSLLIFNTGVNRGRTMVSGALDVLELGTDGFVQRQRVTPTQRWESAFGSSHVLVGDHLLVGAPGYGKLAFSVPGKGGAVFSLPLVACPVTDSSP